VALAAVAGFGLSACGFQPLYGSNTTTASGARLAEAMSSVDVTPIPGRVGQKLRNELIFSNTGGNYAAESRYQLNIAIRESVIDQLVQITGDARGQVYQLQASYKLINVATGKLIYQGTAVSRAPYNRYQEIFANVRARYNAEDRAARTVSESIKTQLAAFLAKEA
jgi:LPS-assembly lipoprotein